MQSSQVPPPPVRQFPVVNQYMTPAPHTIGPTRSLAAARHTMQAMVEDVFIVDPDAPVGEVVEQMIARKLGSAVVCRDDRVIGVFTTIDALRALHELLESS